jgi:hypothetical protein
MTGAARLARAPSAPGPELAIGFLCAGSLGAVALGLVTGSQPPDDLTLCPFRLATGLPCPFCGLTHSLMALGQGEVGASVGYSPLGPAAAAAAVLVSWRLFIARRPPSWPRPWRWAGALAIAVSWTYQLMGELL